VEARGELLRQVLLVRKALYRAVRQKAGLFETAE
jgi:hypothetical protein